VDVVRSTFPGEVVHQADHAHLRGAVVGLTERAENARDGGGEDHPAIVFLVHDRPGVPGDVGAAVQVHVDDDVPLVQRHLLERFVAEDAGVVHDNVDGPERIHGGLDDALRAFPIGNGVLVGDGLTPSGPDFLHHRIRRIALAGSVHVAAEVVDDDLRPVLR